LLGMDIVRLALERSKSSMEALKIITNLIETYGTGGNCHRWHEFYYNNSFVVADSGDAFIIETAEKHWVAKRVVDFASISNAPSISQYDFISDGMIEFAISKKWCSSKADFDFSKTNDALITLLGKGKNRQCRTMSMLENSHANFDIKDAIRILQDHGDYKGAENSIGSLPTTFNVCAHATYGPIRAQTTNTMIFKLSKYENPQIWITGTSSPCLSIFKPIFLDAFPKVLNLTQGQYSSPIFVKESFWWNHENFSPECYCRLSN